MSQCNPACLFTWLTLHKANKEMSVQAAPNFWYNPLRDDLTCSLASHYALHIVQSRTIPPASPILPQTLNGPGLDRTFRVNFCNHLRCSSWASTAFCLSTLFFILSYEQLHLSCYWCCWRGLVPSPAKVEENKMRPKICQRSKCAVNASEAVVLK